MNKLHLEMLYLAGEYVATGLTAIAVIGLPVLAKILLDHSF